MPIAMTMDSESRLDAERRRHERHIRTADLELYDPQGRLLDSQPSLNNISQEGLSFTTLAPVSIGESLNFRLGLRTLGQVSGDAAVRWCRKFSGGYECGAEIMRLGSSHAKRLRGFIDPKGAMKLKVFDLLLAAVCTVVLGMVVNDLARMELAKIGRHLTLMVDLFPAYAVIILSGLGIVFSLKR